MSCKSKRCRSCSFEQSFREYFIPLFLIFYSFVWQYKATWLTFINLMQKVLRKLAIASLFLMINASNFQEIPKIKLHLLEEKHKFIYCFNLFVHLRFVFFHLTKSGEFFCLSLPSETTNVQWKSFWRQWTSILDQWMSKKYFGWMSNIRTKGGTTTPSK